MRRAALSLVAVGVGLVLAWSRQLQSADSPPALNAAVIKYCESKLGKRVGGGECSHLANEALRVAGAEFTQTGADGKKIPDSPNPGDYVWGTLIKTYSVDEKTRKVTDSDPKVKCLPGDIIQFRGVKTSEGVTAPHHTAIVRTVDDAGNPTGIYQQNVNQVKGADGRVVVKATLNPAKLIRGSMLVYRPEPATNPMPYQFSLTNNSNSDKVEFLYVGRKGSLGKTNTSDGFRVIWASRGSDTLYIDGKGYPLATRKGYEFYTDKDGKIALREVE